MSAPKDVGGIRTSSVDPSLSAATTERTHGVQGQHVVSRVPGNPQFVCRVCGRGLDFGSHARCDEVVQS